MRRIGLAALLGLAACTTPQREEASQCAAVLMTVPAPNGAADLLMAAQRTPACMSLGLDLMQLAVKGAMERRGIR